MLGEVIRILLVVWIHLRRSERCACASSRSGINLPRQRMLGSEVLCNGSADASTRYSTAKDNPLPRVLVRREQECGSPSLVPARLGL